jgi:hypothetical protein
MNTRDDGVRRQAAVAVAFEAHNHALTAGVLNVALSHMRARNRHHFLPQDVAAVADMLVALQTLPTVEVVDLDQSRAAQGKPQDGQERPAGTTTPAAGETAASGRPVVGNRPGAPATT